MTPPPLKIEHLTVTYANGHIGLSDISLAIGHDERSAVVGTSGSGKTTLVRAIMGLLPPTATVTGRILVGGVDVAAITARERRRLDGWVIGYVAQDPFAAFDPLRRVRHHVQEAWRAHERDISDSVIDDGLVRVGITEPTRRGRQRPHQWSGGMLQRATTLAATVHGPVLTLADEPTSALDAEFADVALELLRSTCSALLLVTHDLALAGRHTDHIVVLDDGHLIEHAPTAALLASPRHTTTQALLRAATPVPGRSLAPPLSTGAAVLRAANITKSYIAGSARTEAVKTTSMELRRGEVVGIIGASGSGKSTLLRLLSGIERPDNGTVHAEGTLMWGARSTPTLPRPGFAMPIFQDPVGSLDTRWPLWRSITEPLVLSGQRIGRGARRERAARALASIGMSGIAVDRLPGSLSVGQCQRVAVLRGLIADPALLAADEPTASLDVEAASVVSEMLRSAADNGTAVVVVSHDEQRVRSYADRIFRMRDGVIREEQR